MSVLVTGGGSGIGEAAARHFAARGAMVTVTGRRPEKIEGVAASIGSACLAVSGDVSSDADRRGMVDAAVEHGGGRLDVLVSNAGNMYRGPLEQLDEQMVLDVFRVNVVAGMMLAGLCVPHLERTKGAVVFIGSVHTQRAYPGASPYAASKGAVETLTGVLAAELGQRGIRVNCVRPGAVLTELNVRAGADPAAARKRLDDMAGAHALMRIGAAEEIAEAIEYLACAEWTTGAVVAVDGGLGLGVTFM
ncbi:MAG: short-chain dehydrogenase [Candidatus Nephthysia bennettiae]|uniref:SDR family oxidoreductase n=2 Tax=Candidatus Nephthysia bennettiae TaxID=3127016 RepID=A0A934KA65_9BACT|nr:SDR family oxidoreductase [Candidatus Dormibacteraeota bacterium]MBJ7614207.1 SDR family oxidoreductase [Candidatus Dormibacteraeota bacterium]PZR99090.1 MAG: short-chain dehydrogenase [Candidatus Dormibacteraeota bacterium]